MDPGKDPRQIFVFVFSISSSHTTHTYPPLQVWRLNTGIHSDISCLETCLQQIHFVFLNDCLAAYTSAHLFGWHQACLQGDLPVSLHFSSRAASQFWALGTRPLLPSLRYKALLNQKHCFCAFSNLLALMWLWPPERTAEAENWSCQRWKLPSTLVAVKPGECYEDQWHIIAWEL